MKKLLQMKFMLLLCALIVGSGTMWAADPTNVTINFGTTTGYWAAHTNATYTDSDSRVWTRTCSVSNMSGQGGYSQFGNASNTCGSLVFTATAGTDMTVTAFSVTMAGASGGNSPTTGTIYLYKVSGTTETQLATLSVNGSNSVTCSIESSQSFSSTDILKVSYAGTAKAIRISKLEYSYTTSGGDQPTTWTVTYDANGATSGDVPVDENEYDTENSTVTVLGNTGSLAKEHYTFNNWNTADDGSGTGYVAGNTFTISGNTTLYAQWAINSHNVTLPAQNEFGVYTMSAVNPVAYGTEVTLTYNPASGYEKYVAAWSVNGTALEGNKFTMPDEDVTVTVELTEITIDFESAATAYTDWTFTNIVSNYSTTGVTAHGGSKYGSTDGKASGSIQTKERVNPASLTCYVSKQTNNASSSTWYIQVSSDGSTWTDVTTNSATDMDKGEWKKFTAALSNYSDVYVRVYYSGSTAVRLIDDLTLVLKNDTRAEAGLAFNESSYSVELVNAASFTSPVLSNPNELSPITWTSSNETVATVNEGTVTILSEGETTIKAKFEGNDDYKPGEASYVLTVVDNRQTATVTWKDADGNNITELNVEKGDFIQGITLSCNVEGFTFTEGHLQHLWGTNVTHDNYDGLQPAGYIFTPNAVWTAALGITTITATFPGNETHKPASATLTVTVTGGTETTPYTVAEARAAIDAGTGVTEVYATGIVSKIVTPFNSQYGNISYNISADGSTENDQLQAYRGKGIGGADFTSADDIQLGDIVVIKGNLINYQGTYEFAQGNQLVSLVRKPAAPTFDPEEGSYTSVQNVTISTTTAGATIYYTTDGTAPTTESTQYSGAITVDETTTIKAIAVKDSQISDVATAVYVINLSPVITVASPIELDGNTPSKNITISYNNFTPGSDDFGVVYCDENGDELSGGYKWIEKITQWIDETPNTATMRFMFDPNTGSAPRTAYMKIYAMNGNDRVYSELITITQEVYVEPTKVSFYVNGGLIEYSYLKEGDPIVFPKVDDKDGMTFLGWTSNEINGTTDTAPEFVDVTSAKMGTESIDYYAVFALLVAPGTTSTVTDELTKALTGASGSSYSSWEGKKASSDAVYKGNSAGGYDAIQLRSNNSGIVTTTSGGKLKKVTVEWNGNTANDRTLDIYGKNTAYSAASDLYGANTQGTKIGSIVYDGESTELTISGDYTFIGLRSNSGAMYLDKITIEWETGTPNTYSDYCTTIPAMLTVTIAEACTDGSKYYGTFSSSSPFVVPANVTVSEIGINNDGTMNVQSYEEDAVVPANTGVMVSAETFGEHKLIISSEVGTSVLGAKNRLRPTGDNGLTATEMNSAEPETCKFYRLTMHDGTKLGFWWGADGGQSFDIVANKAYLAVPASVAGARNGFAFGDDATGINNVNINLNDNDNCYDLQGRKVSTPGKGLYIVNGKKVVIK